MKRVCVIGGGPAGMMAAYAAAAQGNEVTLFEKNEKLGKKLYITGKGRCNLTNAAPIQDFFDNVVTNSAFLYSAFYAFDNTQLTDMLKRFGLETKTERGGRVFPVSDKSSDVIKALGKALNDVGVHVSLGVNAEDIIIKDGRASGIVIGGNPHHFDSVIIATGGVSYPTTGSNGDGYAYAKRAGHTIANAEASLVGLVTNDDVSMLAGLSLKNVKLSLTHRGKAVYEEQGEMLFTHTGVSGPLVLSASAYMQGDAQYDIVIDLKPALDDAVLDKRLQRDIGEKQNKDFNNVLTGLLPQKLIPLMAARTGISPDKKAHSITREERKALAHVLKTLVFSIKGKRPVSEAVITRGGVSVKEINASTMESKVCPGLYFAGEVIDVDALTGGYNLQIAFSTGYLAGSNC